MANNYKHLYEQMKKIVEKYQDEIVPGLRDVIADWESKRVEVVRCKDCDRGRIKHLPRVGECVECQLYHYEDPRQYKDPNEFCSSGVRRGDDDDA